MLVIPTFILKGKCNILYKTIILCKVGDRSYLESQLNLSSPFKYDSDHPTRSGFPKEYYSGM